MNRVQVAEQLGCSPSEVHRIELAALAKCRRLLEYHGLSPAQLSTVFRGDSEVLPTSARYFSALQSD